MTTEICDICLKEHDPRAEDARAFSVGNGYASLYECDTCRLTRHDKYGGGSRGLFLVCRTCGSKGDLFASSDGFAKMAPGKFVCNTAECRDAYKMLNNPRLDVMHSTPQSDFVSALQKAKAGRRVKWPSRDINW